MCIDIYRKKYLKYNLITLSMNIKNFTYYCQLIVYKNKIYCDYVLLLFYTQLDPIYNQKPINVTTIICLHVHCNL